MLFDTHVHFEPAPTKGATQVILDRALTAGVKRLIAVGGSPQANRQVVEIARANPRQVRAAVGINRDQADTAWPADELATLMSAPEVVAVGEVGLDFHVVPQSCVETMVADPVARLPCAGQDLPHTVRHYNKIYPSVTGQCRFHHESQARQIQIKLFERMLTLARERQLPVIVHSREAETETIALLEQHVRNWKGTPGRIGVQHCFTGSRGFAEKLLGLGFFISFSGILTFKNAASLREIAAAIPENRLLIETDSPWLAPEPFRGRPNEPANVRRVAETLAEIRKTTVDAIAAATFRNAERLFSRSE